jgi:hypothetical protein
MILKDRGGRDVQLLAENSPLPCLTRRGCHYAAISSREKKALLLLFIGIHNAWNRDAYNLFAKKRQKN